MWMCGRLSRGVDAVKLKKEFCKDITFWGGGYVFNQEHNIMPDVPPENIEAMMKAVGCYK